MYPEDVLVLFDMVAVGTKVTVVNQPIVYRWQGDSLYVQSYPPHEEATKGRKGEPPAEQHAVFNAAVSDKMWQRVKPHGGAVDWAVTEQVVLEARGVAVPLSGRGVTYDGFVATARHVENTLPQGANWDGRDSDEPAASAPVPDAAKGGG